MPRECLKSSRASPKFVQTRARSCCTRQEIHASVQLPAHAHVKAVELVVLLAVVPILTKTVQPLLDKRLSGLTISDDFCFSKKPDLPWSSRGSDWSSTYNTFYYDPEGDILLLEAILNSEPPPHSYHKQYMPGELPPHLEYAFLEGDNKLPVIIAKELNVEEKSALVKEVEKLLVAGLITLSPAVPGLVGSDGVFMDDFRLWEFFPNCLFPFRPHASKDAKARLLRWVSPPPRICFKVIDNIETEPRSRSFCPDWKTRMKTSMILKSINERFSLESHVNQQKNKFFRRETFIFGMTPSCLKLCGSSDQAMVHDKEALGHLEACQMDPPGHHGANLTAKKIFDYGFSGPPSIRLPTSLSETVTRAKSRKNSQRDGDASKTPSSL
ncbi:hypothetical protein Tco_0266634 [Tanacetum coccineum]